MYFGGAAVVFPGDRLLAFKAREGIAIVDVLHRPAETIRSKEDA